MKSIDSWALNVCVVTVVTGVLLALVPNGKQKNTLKLVAVTSVLLCFMHPLLTSSYETDLSFDFSAAVINTSDAVQLIEGEVLEYAAYELETELVDCLSSCGYSVDGVRIKLHKYDDGDTKVESVYIDGVADELIRNEVHKKVKELLGEGVAVEFN